MNEFEEYQEDQQPPVWEFMPQLPEHRFEKPKKKSKAAFIALTLAAAIAGTVAGAGLMFLAQQKEPQTQEKTVIAMVEGIRENSVIQMVQADTSEEMTPAQVYAANVRSTVGITTSITTNYWGFQTTSAASGSGFIVSENGYILTNYHVIEGSSAITVSMYDGESYEARLVGYDASNDIAVLKIEAEGLPPVILGDSDNLNVGDTVMAIGNPLGELTFSLTAGMVSAMDRKVTFSDGVTMNLIQTDAAINSGNSGGALFNLYGEVIGVTNAKYSGSSSSQASIDNIGFAIPMNSIRSIVESIIEKGYVAKPYIGVSIRDMGTEYQIYGLPQGAAVIEVTEGGPAQKAGIQAGDIITRADETPITCAEDLTTYVKLKAPGEELVLTVYRQGQEQVLTLTVEEQIQDALAQTAQSQQQTQQMPGMPRGYR